jgi:hypothetical protein
MAGAVAGGRERMAGAGTGFRRFGLIYQLGEISYHVQEKTKLYFYCFSRLYNESNSIRILVL